jgi:hypothetical protein
VIGRMSRRRCAPERSNLSCGPTISRWPIIVSRSPRSLGSVHA